ncbi:MAG TPA: aldo/keto reductase [Chitinophagales bacterium]|nr:aldo/keto reductase [Chitinophagales bacterium]
MQYNQLGKSGIFVSDLCLGTMTFGDMRLRGTTPDEAEKIIHRYLDAGGNHIDTANVYVAGQSEIIIGKALAGGKRHQTILATKANFPIESGKGINEQGLSRLNLLNSVHGSLQRLQTDYIDLLYVHCWDSVTPLEETLATLHRLVQDGKVRYIGVSNYKAWQLMKALWLSQTNGWTKFVAAQYQYSLVKRDIEYEFTEICLNEGLSLIPWSPLGGGFLTGKYQKDQRPRTDFSDGRIGGTPARAEDAWERRSTPKNWDTIDALNQIAPKYNASVAQLALAWARLQPAVGSVIFGARTQNQLEDNLKAAEIVILPEDMALLNQTSMPDELYPYRFISEYGRKK